MEHFLSTILAISKDAQAIPRMHFRQPLSVDQKHDDSPVTQADRATEKFIRDAISKHFPDHGIFGEEFGEKPGDSEYMWVIDPIDGTRSFISGMPLYGMLIALLKRGEPVLGVVRMPELSEVYYGTEAGAFMNENTALKTSDVTELSRAFLYINEAHKIIAECPDIFARINGSSDDQRFSFDCYPHMLVASGHIDACIDYDLQPYDYLSLSPIIQAAGGVISDWNGQSLTMQSDGRIVTSANRQLHAQILKLLAQN